MPLVSVIVTTKNEERNLGRCLESVQLQTCRDLEVIVVDNSSTDKTQEIARRHTDNVYTKGPERSAQRNFGVSQASGEFVLYLDADMILNPGVIEDCVTILRARPEVVALYIPERIVGRGFWIKVRSFERTFYDGTVIDAVRFLRRSTFLAVGGFDETLTGPEDWDFDLAVRKAGPVAVSTVPLSHNEDGFQLSIYLKKKRYYAQAFDGYIRKHGADHPDVKKQLGFAYRYIGVFTEHGKVWRLIFHPLLTAAMFGLRFAVGVTYLRQRRLKA